MNTLSCPTPRIYIDGMASDVQFQAFWKPDQWPNWVPWYSWTEKYDKNHTGTDPGFRPRIGDCPIQRQIHSTRPTTGRCAMDLIFQFKLVMTGSSPFSLGQDFPPMSFRNRSSPNRPQFNSRTLKRCRSQMTSLATNTGLCVRVVESTPASNVARCVGIGVGGEAARRARDLVASWSVFLADTAARRTSPARVARVNQFNQATPISLLFVGNLRFRRSAKAHECKDSALLFSSPNPRTNMRQIFQRLYSPLRAFSNFRNLFGDGVVRDLAQNDARARSIGATRAWQSECLWLEAATLSPTPCADTASNLAGVTESLAVGAFGEIGQSQIEKLPIQPTASCSAFFRHVHRHVQKPFVAAKNQIRFAFSEVQAVLRCRSPQTNGRCLKRPLTVQRLTVDCASWKSKMRAS